MKRSVEIVLLLGLALASVLVWRQFSLPRYQQINFDVNQTKALSLAREYMLSRGFPADEYRAAAVFRVDDGIDRYLQKTLGFAATTELMNRLDYDLFTWVVRFFKEKNREEFKVSVSSKTGKIIGFFHDINDTEARPFVEKDVARVQAVRFLVDNFGFQEDRYMVHREDSKKLDNRVEYTFSWESKDVDIPWNKEFGGGSAKLLTTVSISGTDILSFRNLWFKIPEGFSRHVDTLKQTGENLTLVFKVVYLALLTFSIMLVVNRKHHRVPRIVRPFYVNIGIAFFALMLLENFNGIQYLLFGYPTTQTFGGYVVRQMIESLLAPFFLVLAFILPGLAGEALRFEHDAGHKNRGFLSPVLSSFHSFNVGRQIFVGYLVGAIVLGTQAALFHVGHTFWGVWNELSWMTQSSTTLFPAFTAFLIAFQAAFSEEVMFRLFVINLLKRYRVAAGLAVVLSAAAWGFGHTFYAIYPMWFRGLEVTCLGIILGIAYLRYGLISAIAAHFFMDAFLICLPYLLHPGTLEFLTSLIVLAIPLVFALWALGRNHSEEERGWESPLNAQQRFNYSLLQELFRQRQPQDLAAFKKDLLHHGWDPAIVERAFNEHRPS